MDLFKIFDSGHLYGVGRIIVISTVHQNDEKFIVEIFAFSYYDGSIFKGRVIGYDFDASEIIDDEFEVQSKNIVYEILTDKYNLTNDVSMLSQTTELTEINKSILINLKSQNFHVDTFKDICTKTNCISFRDYLSKILSIPSIIIRDY